MIPLLINVEVTGKGAKKAELSLHAGNRLVHGKALMRLGAGRLPYPPLPAVRMHFLLCQRTWRTFVKSKNWVGN